MLLRQGIGKLLRKKTDYGVIFFFDHRFSKQKHPFYVQKIREAFPCPLNVVERTVALQEMDRFLSSFRQVEQNVCREEVISLDPFAAEQEVKNVFTRRRKQKAFPQRRRRRSLDIFAGTTAQESHEQDFSDDFVPGL